MERYSLHHHGRAVMLGVADKSNCEHARCHLASRTIQQAELSRQRCILSPLVSANDAATRCHAPWREIVLDVQQVRLVHEAGSQMVSAPKCGIEWFAFSVTLHYYTHQHQHQCQSPKTLATSV